MKLRELSSPAPTKLVKVTDTEGFTVRGLSPAHIVGLYYRHRMGSIGSAFDRARDLYVKHNMAPNGDTVTEFLLGMMQDAPLLMAELIALGSDSDPEDEANWAADVAVAQRLTFPVQVDALTKVHELTFTSDMPPGKFVSLVAKMVRLAPGSNAKS